MVEKYDVIIAGAGVVGLAVGARLAEGGRKILVLEKENRIGAGVSSRNSGVIHAGLYYPEGSLKAALCARGNAMMYAFCAQAGVPHAQTGKWVVATRDEEVERLHDLKRQGERNGAPGLEIVDGTTVMASEPAVHAVGGLWSPSSGVVDVHALMLALEGKLQHHGGMVVTGAPVVAVKPEDDGFLVRAGRGETVSLRTNVFINAAGIGAQALAHTIDGLGRAHIPKQHLAKGHYFSYSGASPFSHLIYPVPEAGGLGVHATLDAGGGLRFGPDVEAVTDEDYSVNPERKGVFLEAIRRYFPGVDEGRLQPDFAGIRPKVVPANQTADFVISGPKETGFAGLYNLFGVESPGLTCSLALADTLYGDIVQTT